MSNQLQIESYRISMRKLRTFYWKVTEFLNDDKITCLQGLDVIIIINVYWRTIPTGYLYRLRVYLCILVACLCCLIHNVELCIFEITDPLYLPLKIRLSERRENLFFFLGADCPSGWVVWGVFRVSVYCVLNLVILRGCSVKYRHTYIKSLYFCSCNIY